MNAKLKEILHKAVGTALPVHYKRKFNGETFDLDDLDLTKPDADSMAQKIRKKGHKARVVKTRVYRWAVYIKRKK